MSSENNPDIENPDHESVEKVSPPRERVVAKEYRLIPLEAEEEGSDWQIQDLIKELWEYRKVVLITLGIVLFIGMVIALTKPHEYEATTTVLIESQSESAAQNLLRQYGGILGISGGGSQSGQLSSDLYPQIATSLPFQLDLIEEELTFSLYDTTATIYTFFSSIYQPSLFHFLKDHTIGLNTLENQLGRGSSNPETLDAAWRASEIYDLPSTQEGVAKGMSEIVSVSVNEGQATIEVSMPDPLAAAQMVQKVKDLLSEHIIEYRTEKAQQNFEFIKKQYETAKERFIEAQDRLAEFRDQNRNLATAQARTQEQRLESEYNLAFDVYNNLAQQLEQARIKVQEDTPVFHTLKPVELPGSYSSPDRVLILLASIFLGLFFGVIIAGGIIVTKNAYFSFTES